MVQGIERRKHPRAYFTVRDSIFAVFQLPEPEKFSMSTNVLSLSAGGISFIGQKEALEDVKAGHEILLVRVFEPEELHFLHNIRLQVRHTINEPGMEHILAGCRFIDISETQKEGISKFVTGWLNRSE
ncbi:MAG: PilZ domain-containing protein [Acidobacteria bacterium]|nr:PilZ domain-containing protein [Acidobacteriota bacterium]